jgi:outer membrane lipoprotein carrier protein
MKPVPLPQALGLLLLLCLVANTGRAGAVPDYVREFFHGLATLQADFDQQVIDSESHLVQSSRGHMWIRRPGRFRWDYEAPYRQQLVADGERFWSYDEDLEQVTVRPAAEVLTATPAMLLSGEQPLEEVFSMEETGAGGAEHCVRLSPKSGDSNIETLELIFAHGAISRIEARDSFGNTTIFSFTNLKRNPVLDPGLFRFVPPPGADVIGDAG